MCGRYLIEEEAYSDILEILYRSGAIPGAPAVTGGAAGSFVPAAAGAQGAADALPAALREAMAETMAGRISETVSGSVRGLFPGGPAIITNGEVFPTNIAPVLISGGEGVMTAKWGFPHWKNSNVIINARSETALEKQMFRKSLLERRCVVLSNGFYEWGAGGKSYDDMQIKLSGSHQDSSYSHSRRKKTKYLLRRPDEKKLYMAGFLSTFRESGAAPGNGEYTAFVILTTAANASVSPIHGRMPLILSPDECDDWLNDPAFMQYALLRPGPELTATAAAA